MEIIKKDSSWQSKIKKEDFLLDVGCWDGTMIKHLLNKCQPYGIDIDRDKLDLATNDIRDRLFLGDITKKETINKIKKRFNWIFLGEVLEHIEKDDLALKNINFLLNTEGRLVLTTPNSIFLLEFWDPAWIKWKLLGGQRHYHYTKKELYKKLEKNGFTIEEIRLLGSLKWLFFRWVNTISKNILKNKKPYICEKKKGFFDWEVVAIKNER
jgi:2-polyprenyl-3-methyl-5-hydroxy-6-metoxy-1,4-benzoquinol methylase